MPQRERQLKYLERELKKGRKRATLWVSADFQAIENPATLQMQKLQNGQIALVPDGFLAVAVPPGVFNQAKDGNWQCFLTYDPTTKWAANWRKQNGTE